MAKVFFVFFIKTIESRSPVNMYSILRAASKSLNLNKCIWDEIKPIHSVFLGLSILFAYIWLKIESEYWNFDIQTESDPSQAHIYALDD